MEDYKRVAVDEAIRLAQHQTLDVFYYVREVVQAVANGEAAGFPTQDAMYNLMWGAVAAWEAGRVAGIRAERVRRNPERREQERKRELKEKQLTTLLKEYKKLNDEGRAVFDRALSLFVEGPAAFKDEFVVLSKQDGPVKEKLNELLDKWTQKPLESEVAL